MDEELVSIIVPVYKTEYFLAECIESLINQTYKKIEIILVDDGSPDESGKICDEYKEIDKRIKVIHQKNQGVSVARNKGLYESKGSWVIFVDGDDVAEKNMVEKLYNATQKDDCEIVFGNYNILTKQNKLPKIYFKGSGKIFSSEEKNILIEKCMENLGVPWGKIYKKSLIVDNNIEFKPNLKRMQDSIFNIYIFKESTKIKYIEDIVYNYRQFMESSCYKYTKDIDITSMQILNETKQFIEKYNLQKELMNAYYKKCVKLLIEIVKLKYIPYECKMSYKQKIKQIKQLIKEEPYKQAKSKAIISQLNTNYRIGYLLIKFNFINLLYVYYKLIYINKNKVNYKNKEGKK